MQCMIESDRVLFVPRLGNAWTSWSIFQGERAILLNNPVLDFQGQSTTAIGLISGFHNAPFQRARCDGLVHDPSLGHELKFKMFMSLIFPSITLQKRLYLISAHLLAYLLWYFIDCLFEALLLYLDL